MKRQHQRHSADPWLDGGVSHGSGGPLGALASRSSRNIGFPILPVVLRGSKLQRISFRIARKNVVSGCEDCKDRRELIPLWHHGAGAGVPPSPYTSYRAIDLEPGRG